MAGAHGPAAHPVSAPAREPADALRALELALQREPYRFGFYSTLRLLEGLNPDKPGLGRSHRPSEDPVRLSQEPSLSFPSATLQAYVPAKDGVPARLAVNFLGLLGPNGPLPLHLTEYARDRVRNAADPTLARFLDMFHHRMLSLFYRAWAAVQPTVNFDRPQDDCFAVYTGALMGIGTPAMRDRDAFPDHAKLYYAGRYAAHTKCAEGLEAVVADFFKLPVTVVEFVGEWLRLPQESRWRLGETLETGSLGVNTTVGASVWGCQHKFRLVFGPLGLADYRRMLPTGESLPRLVAAVRNYVGDQFNWDVQLILRGEAVPRTVLGEFGQLGWTTWLSGDGHAGDAADLRFSPIG